MSLGNDIVDLKYESMQTHHPKFAARVLSEREKNFHNESLDAELYLWKAWAAKEAAYKAAKKIDGKTIFSPRKFKISNLEMTELSYGAMVFRLCFIELDSYVYCTATSNDINAKNKIVLCDDGGLHSPMARKILIDELATQLHCQIADLSIQKDTNHIPRLYHCGELVPLEISITHHGSYIGVAWESGFRG